MIKTKNSIYAWWICAIAGLFYCYEFILRILPGTLQNELTSAFGNVSATVFGQISACYYFAYSPMQLPVGMLMDTFGPRKLLICAALCCTLGSWMFMETNSIPLASFGRFLVGFGSSFAFVGVLSLATHWVSPRYFSLVAGLITTMGMLGNVYGEMKITSFTIAYGLPHVLKGAVYLGLIVTFLIALFVVDTPEGHDKPKHVWQTFLQSVAKVIISKNVWIIGVIGACLYTSLSVFGELWGKSYLEQAHHLTKYQAAQSISMLFIGWAIGAPLSGYVSDNTGNRITPLIISALVSFIAISILIYIPHLSHLKINILMLVYGIFSSAEIIVFIMGKEYSGVNLSGTAYSVINMIVTLGGVILQPMVGHLLDKFGASEVINGVRLYTTHSYQIAMSVIPASLILIFILIKFLQPLQDKGR